jgi:hypothetical protein
MRAAVERCELDLSGLTVLTEAASGAYVVTPVLAALAGAERVLAVTRPTRYGTVEEVRAATCALARACGVEDRIVVTTACSRDLVAQADIVTNSGHVRPLDAPMITAMKPGTVVALMYEGWEFRADDLDLEACRAAGVLVAGSNERHPHFDVFSYLGPLAVKLLADAGVGAYGSSILLLCDNPFVDYLSKGLRAAGASVEVAVKPADARGDAFDAIVVSLTPRKAVVLDAADARVIACRWPDAVVGQFFGDIDRAALAALDVVMWPPAPPAPGHMGVLLSELGPDPIVRLQAAGLKSAEVLWRRDSPGTRSADQNYVEVLVDTDGIRCHAYC